MAEDKEVKKYAENMPYGNDAKASEVHGKHNQLVINKVVTSAMRGYDKAMAEGDKEQAGLFFDSIKNLHKNLENLMELKKEFFVNYGGGAGGSNLFSNYTNLNWHREFFLEKGRILFDETLRPVLSVNGPNGEEKKYIEDVSEDWVVKGSEENDFMRLQQSAVKQRNTQGVSLDFDPDWEISKMCDKSWKVLLSDKIGGRYFLHDYMIENQDKIKSGELKEDMLSLESFNPEFDTRLHQYYSNRIKRAFDPNYQTAQEVRKAEELKSRIKTENKDNV